MSSSVKISGQTNDEYVPSGVCLREIYECGLSDYVVESRKGNTSSQGPLHWS